MALNTTFYGCAPFPNHTEGQCVGTILPFFDESSIHPYVRAGFYLLGLLYMFLGIAIAADIFMIAIERITSEKRVIRIFNEATGKEEEREVDVWNPTVANLSLMALGSSAPEILLSIIELVGLRFFAGKLGPSTIVGSAAFNLLCITGFCIIAVPKKETRRISQFSVFVITALFGMFAYFWLMLILVFFSPNVVEIWEGVMTLIFFITLIVFAYMADKKICCQKRDGVMTMAMSTVKEDLLRYGQIEKELATKNPNLTAGQIARLTAAAIDKQNQHGRTYYRLATTKWLSKHIDVEKENVPPDHPSRDSLNSAGGANSLNLKDEGQAIVEFSAEKYAVNESDGFVTVELMRTGCTTSEIEVFVETIDGSARKFDDYRPFEEIVKFKRNQTELLLNVKIVEDDEEENDEIFYVRLDKATPIDKDVKIGDTNIAEITITEKNDPCVVEFEKSSFIVEETCGHAIIPVTRSGQYNRAVTVTYDTRDITATDSEDYMGGPGSLTFEPGEVKKCIKIPIIDDVEVGEKHESFQVVLKDIKNARLGTDHTALVTIIGDERVHKWFNEVDSKVAKELEDLQTLETHTWREQFRRSLNVNGGDTENASFGDYALHVASFGWKFLLAFVPPAHIGRGWVTFVIAIIVIGMMTAIVADMASIFGCLVHLDDSITAITLVALGTSFPDLFASKIAAVNEKTADSAIGNVNGSNSVNVFLGLGLPWTIAAVYWHLKGLKFCVPAGSLKVSAAVYLIFSLCAYILLFLRRKVKAFGRAELGGNVPLKFVCGLTLWIFWIMYVVLSSLASFGQIDF